MIFENQPTQIKLATLWLTLKTSCRIKYNENCFTVVYISLTCEHQGLAFHIGT